MSYLLSATGQARSGSIIQAQRLSHQPEKTKHIMATPTPNSPTQNPSSTPADIRWIYITASNREEARHIGQTLVEEKLAACVNLLAPMESIYVWKGALQHDEEVVLIAKTTGTAVPSLTQRVKELHSYEVPCILSIPVALDEGNEDFLAWIGEQVEAG